MENDKNVIKVILYMAFLGIITITFSCNNENEKKESEIFKENCNTIVEEINWIGEDSVRFGGVNSLYDSTSLHLFFYLGFTKNHIQIFVDDKELFNNLITTKPQLGAARYIEIKNLDQLKGFELWIDSCKFYLKTENSPTNIISFDKKGDVLVKQYLNKPIPIL